jgi:2-polyprenyl-6-methoxyphenol hydroxylase-like FAD-dependent oxidoreductase
MAEAPADRTGLPVRSVVVGGSLVGLSAAIALSRLGMEVTVLERSPAAATPGGGGLGVDIELLGQVTGIRDEPPVVHGVDRDTTAWHLLQGWLEGHALRRPGLTMHRGTVVTTVDPGGERQQASVVTEDGTGPGADLVIGADGARSTVRAAVEPDQPDARYAGVLLWRTLVAEQALPAGLALPSAGEPSREVYAGPYRLVTYLVAANWPSPWRDARWHWHWRWGTGPYSVPPSSTTSRRGWRAAGSRSAEIPRTPPARW